MAIKLDIKIWEIDAKSIDITGQTMVESEAVLKGRKVVQFVFDATKEDILKGMNNRVSEMLDRISELDTEALSKIKEPKLPNGKLQSEHKECYQTSCSDNLSNTCNAKSKIYAECTNKETLSDLKNLKILVNEIRTKLNFYFQHTQ